MKPAGTMISRSCGRATSTSGSSSTRTMWKDKSISEYQATLPRYYSISIIPSRRNARIYHNKHTCRSNTAPRSKARRLNPQFLQRPAPFIKFVISSAAKVKLGAFYIMARKAICIRVILVKLEHKQLHFLIQTDNSKAERTINNKVESKRTKAMDTWLHWLRIRLDVLV